MIRHSKRLPSKLLEAGREAPEPKSTQSEVDILFTGDDTTVIGAIAASPGVELIKRYVYPSGSWKAEDGKVIDGSRAVSEQVHEVLLCWRRKHGLPQKVTGTDLLDLETRYLLPRVDSENPLIDTIATFESRTPYGSPSDSHTLLSSLADGSAYDSEYTTSPTRFEFLRKEVAALNELEDDPSSDYASNAGSSDVEDHSAGRGLTTDTFYTSRNIYYSPPSVATHLGPSVKQASPDQESEFRQRPSDRLERESPQSLSTLDESEELIEEDSSLQIRSADGNYNIVHPVGNGNDHERVQNDGNNTTGRPFIHHIYRSPDQGRNEDIRNAHQEIRRLLALLRRSEAERKQLSEQLAQEQIKHEAEMHSARMKAASVEDPLRLVGTSAEVQNHRTSMERHAEKNLPKDSRLADAQVQDHSEEHRSDGAIGVDAGRDMLLESMHTEKDALAARRGDNVDAMASSVLMSAQRREVTNDVAHGSSEGITPDGLSDYDAPSEAGKTPQIEHRRKAVTAADRERFRRHLYALDSQVTSAVSRINTLLLYVKGSSYRQLEAEPALVLGSNVDLRLGNEKRESSMNDLAIPVAGTQSSNFQRHTSQSSLSLLSSVRPLGQDRPSQSAHDRATPEPSSNMIIWRIINIPLFIFIVQTTISWNPDRVHRAMLTPVKWMCCWRGFIAAFFGIAAIFFLRRAYYSSMEDSFIPPEDSFIPLEDGFRLVSY